MVTPAKDEEEGRDEGGFEEKVEQEERRGVEGPEKCYREDDYCCYS